MHLEDVSRINLQTPPAAQLPPEILLVEGDAEGARHLVKAMRTQGVERPVSIASGIKAAVHSLTEGDRMPALVLVDLDDPLAGGLSLLAFMARLTDAPPVFGMTRDEASPTCAAAEALGIDGFVRRDDIACQRLGPLLVTTAQDHAERSLTPALQMIDEGIVLVLVEPSDLDARAVTWTLRRKRIVNTVAVAKDGFEARKVLADLDAKGLSDRALLLDLDRPAPGVLALVHSAAKAGETIIGLCDHPENLPPHVGDALAGTVRKSRIGDDVRKVLETGGAYWRAVPKSSFDGR